MSFWEVLIVAFDNIRSNKLRSFLTTLGIVIGIAAVISVVAIGQGGRAMLINEMEKMGTNMFAVWVNYSEGESWRPGDLQVNDINVIKEAVPEIEYLAPISYYQGKLRGKKGEESVLIMGTNPDLLKIRNLQLAQGRFLSEDDESAARRVIVIEEDTARNLFGSENPLGQRVVIGSNSAVVIGVIKKDSSAISFDSRQNAYIPLAFMDQLRRYQVISELWGSAVSKEDVDTAMEKCKMILERRHNAPDHYYTYSMEQEMQSANKIIGIMSMIISCIAGISLLVGGIGVMNIMLVSVTERTREIGIRMALGARRRDILFQFLVESIVLCLLGGFIGTILGYGGAFIVASIAKWPPLVSWWTVAIAFAFSAGIGLFFGIYPANRAAKLDPIEALRRD